MRPDIKVPVLHRVVYTRLYDGVKFQYEKTYRDYIIHDWLKTNCQHPYYSSPDYLSEKFVEFECDEDATFFALRWV